MTPINKKKKINRIANNELREKHPQTWREQILDLPDDIRNHVARLVWWDWFSYRPVPERWPHLDEFLNVPYSQLLWERANPELVVQPDFRKVCEALISLGYSEQQALQRA